MNRSGAAVTIGPRGKTATWFAASALLFVLSIQPAAQASTARAVDWLLYGYDLTHTGFNPAEHRLGLSNVGQLTRAWTFTTGGSVFTAPTVVDGVVYVGSADDNLYALDARTGQELWAFPTGDVIINSTATVSHGVVYVGSFDDRLYAIDAATGTERWSLLSGGDVASSPVVSGGAVYVGSADGLLYKADAATGQVIWTARTKSIGVYGGISGEAAAISGGVVYVGAADHRLYAFDAATGHKLWSAKTNGTIVEAPVVAGGLVYVNSEGFDGALYAFDAATGQQIWRLRHSAAATVANGVLYYTYAIDSQKNALVAADALTGRVIWATSMPFPDAPASKETVANGLVYVGTGEGHVVALDAATGQIEWTGSSPSTLGVAEEPTVVNGSVYISSAGHDVDAFHVP